MEKPDKLLNKFFTLLRGFFNATLDSLFNITLFATFLVIVYMIMLALGIIDKSLIGQYLN